MSSQAREALVNLRRDVLQGGKSNARSAAMAALAASSFRNKHLDLQAVLADEDEEPGVRSLAASYLGRIGTPAALDILIENAGIGTPAVLARILDVLGRLGDRRALDAVLEIKARVQGPLAARAEFAASLLAHRLGLDGSDMPVQRGATYLSLERRDAYRVNVRPAEADRVLQVLSALRSSYRLDLAERPAYEIACPGSTSTLLLNRDCVGSGAVDRLRRRKAVVGLVCRRDPETHAYAATELVFAAPAKDDHVQIHVFRPSGRHLLGGEARAAGEVLEFGLFSVSRPGAQPTELIGTLGDHGLAVTSARAALAVRPKLKATEAPGSGPEPAE